MVTVPVPPVDVGGGFIPDVVVDLGVVVVVPSLSCGVVSVSVVVVVVVVVVLVIVIFLSLSVPVQLYSTPVFRIKGYGYFLTCPNQNLYHKHFHWRTCVRSVSLFRRLPVVLHASERGSSHK